MVNDLWVSKLRKADVPCVQSWILNDSTGVVDVIKQLNLSRSEVDKTSPLMLQSFDLSTLYTKIDLMDLKAHIKVPINKVFHHILKLYWFKFSLVQRSVLNFRFLWLKNKEINLFEYLQSFKVVEASDLISWLDFLLDYLFFVSWSFVICFVFLLWNSLWLVEEVLTSLCLLLIVRMEISWFLWEIYNYHVPNSQNLLTKASVAQHILSLYNCSGRVCMLAIRIFSDSYQICWTCLPMCFSSQTIATYFSQVMAAVGANTAGPGIVLSDWSLHCFL